MKSSMKKTFFLLIEITLFPIIILEALLFILKNNKKIFENKIIYPNFTWSFGHQILSLDWIARIYYPNKILMLEFLHERNNKYLSNCYQNIKVISIYSKKNYPFIINKIRFKVILFILYFFKIFYKYEIIKYEDIYNKLSVRKTISFKYYNELKGKIENYGDISGYGNILNFDIGIKPTFPSYLEIELASLIKSKHPELDFSKVACIQFRKSRGNTFYDRERTCNPLNYISSINFLAESGYTVFLLGDSNYNRTISAISQAYSINLEGIDQTLLDLFLLFKSNLFISQHSGPIYLANSLGIPVIVCDSFPFYIGTFNSNDIILFKNTLYKQKILKVSQIIVDYPEIIYGYGFIEGKYKLIENTSDQILNAIKRLNLTKMKFPDDVLISSQNNFIVNN